MTPKSNPLQRRPFTELERERALALGTCRVTPRSFDKRWSREMADRARETNPAITIKEAACLARMAWKYRKQLPPRLVPDVKPDDLRAPAPAKTECVPVRQIAVPRWNPA